MEAGESLLFQSSLSKFELYKVHGDVFRAAASPMLFSSLIGTGAQLAVVVLFVVVFAIIGAQTAVICKTSLLQVSFIQRGVPCCQRQYLSMPRPLQSAATLEEACMPGWEER